MPHATHAAADILLVADHFTLAAADLISRAMY
jgi:hypothetical protein